MKEIELNVICVCGVGVRKRKVSQVEAGLGWEVQKQKRIRGQHSGLTTLFLDKVTL